MSISTCSLSPEPPEANAEAPVAYPHGTALDGTYRLVGQLASGGMGEIYAATHARLPGLFAIKILQAGLSTDVDILERFRREAEVMATLRHPHVAQVVDYNVTFDGRPYLVMEHLDGADLAEVARQHGQMHPALVADFVRQTAGALAAAHAKGIVHLDLKPENVMVLVNEDRTPFVKVIDFGIAKSCQTPTDGPRTIIGTPDYMSPEQVNGSMDAIDGRSDQFSLAVVAYYLLTGHSPWGSEEPVTTLYRICQEPPQPFANYLAVPLRETEAVLARALSKEAADRFESVMEFSRAFDDAVAWDLATAPQTDHRTSAADAEVLYASADVGVDVDDLREVTPAAAPVRARELERSATDLDPVDESVFYRPRRRARMGATALAVAAGLVAWLASGPRMRASLLTDVLRWVPTTALQATPEGTPAELANTAKPLADAQLAATATAP